jgi:hypothetical protein
MVRGEAVDMFRDSQESEPAQNLSLKHSQWRLGT